MSRPNPTTGNKNAADWQPFTITHYGAPTRAYTAEIGGDKWRVMQSNVTGWWEVERWNDEYGPQIVARRERLYDALARAEQAAD